MPTALGGGMHSYSSHTGKRRPGVWIARAVLPVVLLLSPRLIVGAQGYAAMQPMATRADLTALADRLSRGSEADRNKAAVLRTRLRDGDFRAGDRIRLVLDGSVTQDDTIPVVAGSKVQLKDVGEISLAGVLRSELQSHMSTQLAKYIKDVRVRASPLAVMRAGGPSASADLNKSVIRRNTEELYDSRNTRTAMNEGLTLDQLSLRDGDSIEIGEKSGSNWQKIASVVGVASTLIWALTRVSRN
jgi:PHD/YefM family antitoxin component YafN of YafNO toxin-antitoxin module